MATFIASIEGVEESGNPVTTFDADTSLNVQDGDVLVTLAGGQPGGGVFVTDIADTGGGNAHTLLPAGALNSSDMVFGYVLNATADANYTTRVTQNLGGNAQSHALITLQFRPDEGETFSIGGQADWGENTFSTALLSGSISTSSRRSIFIGAGFSDRTTLSSPLIGGSAPDATQQLAQASFIEDILTCYTIFEEPQSNLTFQATAAVQGTWLAGLLVLEVDVQPDIKTIGAAGDYTTIAAWSTYVKGLGTLTNDVEGRLIDDGAYAYTTDDDLSFGVVTRNGNVITLRGYGDGLYNPITGTGARIEGTTNGRLVSLGKCDLKDVAVINLSSGSSAIGLRSSFNTNRGNIIERCYIKNSGSNQSCVQLFFTNTVRGCIVEGGTLGIECLNGGDIWVENNTVINCATNGIECGNSEDDLYVRNNVTYNITGDDYNISGTSTAGFRNNASEDGTQPSATGNITLSGDPFVDSASGDYSIDKTSELWDAGASQYVPELDVARKPFFSSIGAFEITANFSQQQSTPNSITNEATSLTEGVNVDGSFTAPHTPTGTPSGAFVWVMRVSASATVTGVTYGGVAMTEVTGSPITLSNGYLCCYQLTSGVLSGAQDAVVSLSGTATTAAYVLTLSSEGTLSIQDTDIIDTTASNPRGKLELDNQFCYCVTGLYDDNGAPAGQNPLSNWTQAQSSDMGSKSSSLMTYDLISHGDVVTGWDNGEVDNGGISLAIIDSVNSGATPPPVILVS